MKSHHLCNMACPYPLTHIISITYPRAYFSTPLPYVFKNQNLFGCSILDSHCLVLAGIKIILRR